MGWICACSLAMPAPGRERACRNGWLRCPLTIQAHLADPVSARNPVLQKKISWAERTNSDGP